MRGFGSTVRKATYKNVITVKELASELFEKGATAQSFKLKKDIMKKVEILLIVRQRSLIFIKNWMWSI